MIDMEPITNSDLKESFDRHSADDKLFQDAQGQVNEATAKSLAALHERLGDVATREDVAELKKFLKSVDVGVGIFRFTFNNASKIGTFLIFTFGVYLFLKLGLVGVIAWFRSIGAI